MTMKKGKIKVIEERIMKESEAEHITARKKLIDEMSDEDSEILTIIKGEDATDEEVDQLVSYVEENYDEVEVEVLLLQLHHSFLQHMILIDRLLHQ
ncbi:hypothetical protein BS756_00415 [Staphylococcus sp. MB371]